VRTPALGIAVLAATSLAVASTPCLHAQRPAPVAAQGAASQAPPAFEPAADTARAGVDYRMPRMTAGDVTGEPHPLAPTSRRAAPWWAPLASAVVPGAGQAALGHDRWIAFAAVEGLSWLRYVNDRHEAHRERRGYQRLANEVARALYSTGAPAAGSFEYYETMEKWLASGVYDAQPGGALTPETDTSTFNGAIWLRARETYWADVDEPPIPESAAYQNAIAYYERRAIRPEFRWSWRDAQLQQDLFSRGILRSNAAYRRVAEDLAAVLANHVLSTVDAYVTVRLRRRPGAHGAPGAETSLEATLPWPRGGSGGR
jgi:hypothetical protein